MTDKLDLFIHRGDFCSYVIANQLIGFEKHAGECNSPFRSFNLLIEMFNYNQGKKIIPKKFHELFSKASKIGFDECVLGEMEYHSFRYCLDFTLNIINKRKPFLFSDFILYFSPSQRLKLPKVEVKMKPIDAFYTLANICVTGCYFDFYTIDRLKSDEMFEKLFKNHSFQEKINSYPANVKLAYKFAIIYVNYIKQLLEQKKIFPKQLLSKSGAFILALLSDLPVVYDFSEKHLNRLINGESMTVNEKIQFYSLFKLIKKEPLQLKINDFFMKNTDVINNLENEILKPFPKFWLK